MKLTLGKNKEARVRFSYVNVFTPRENDRGVQQFSTAILIPKTLPNGKPNPDVKLVEDAFNSIVNEEKAGKFKGIHISKLNNPLNDGDIKFEEDPDKYAAYEGHFYLNAKKTVKNASDKVIVMDQYAKPISESDNLFFSGCYGAAIVSLFPYNNNSKGVGVALDAVQYRYGSDEDRLGGGGTSVNAAAEAFGAEDEEDLL